MDDADESKQTVNGPCSQFSQPTNERGRKVSSRIIIISQYKRIFLFCSLHIVYIIYKILCYEKEGSFLLKLWRWCIAWMAYGNVG